MAETNWDEVANEVAGTSEREAYKRSMQVAATRNPDEHAQVVSTARKLDIPAAVITPNNFEDAKREADAMENRFEALADVSPRTTKWLTNPDNSSLAKDDVKNLQKIEESVHEHSAAENFFNTLGSGMAGLNASIMRIPDALIAGYQYPMNKAIQIFDLPYKQSSPGDIWENSGAKFYEDQQKALAAQSDWLNINTEKALADGDVKKVSKYLAAQVLSNAPNQVINLIAAYAGVGLPALIETGLGVAGQSVAESEKNGVMPSKAFEAAALKGTTEGLFESIGTFGLFKKWEGKIFESLGSGSFKTIMADVGKTLGHTMLGEGNEEALTSLMQDFSDYATGNNPQALDGIWGRAFESGLVGALSGATMTTPATFLAGARRQMTTFKAEAGRDHYLNLEEQMQNSKLQMRDGQYMQSFNAEATKGSASENVYIDPQVLTEYFEKKDIDPVQVMKGMGMIEKWNAAKESGSAMEIPTAVMLKQLAGTEHYKALANDIKFSPDGMSVNEAKLSAEEAKAEEEQRRAQMAEQSYASHEEDVQKFNEKSAANRLAIRQNIAAQLEKSGFSKEDAWTNAIIHEKFFGTLETQYGLDAEKIFAEYGPQIVKGTFTLPDTEGGVVDKSIVQKIKEIIGGKETDPAVQAAALEEAKARKDKEFQDRIQSELDAGHAVKKDKKGNIIPQLTVLYSLRSDIEAGGEWTPGVLVFDEKTNAATRVGGQSMAKKYIQDAKKGMSYSHMKKRIDQIISKVEANKPLNSHDNTFLTGYYEGATDDLMNEIGRSQVKRAAQSVIDISKSVHSEAYDADGNFILFEQNGKNIQGSYTPEKRLIKIGESKTMATFLHESGHYFFDVVEQIVKSGQAPEGLMDDYLKIRQYVGAEAGKVLTVEQHEKFADAFVNYLGTGKAPSKSLRKAFQTFKNWLFTVYSGVRLNPALSPDIIAVFDRLLASRQEIQEQIDELTPVDYGHSFEADVMNRYNQLKPELQMDSEDKMVQIALERENKKNAKEYRERESKVKAKFTEEANTMQVFKVIDQIQNDEYVDKINRADVEKYGQKFAAEFPPGLMKRDGSSAEILAGTNGYESEFAMLKDISANPDMDQWIKNQTDAEMARLYPELQPKQDLSEDAKKALHNETREKKLIMEMDQLAIKAHGVLKGIAKKLIARAPRVAAIKSAAVFAVGAKKVSDIKPHLHRRAEVKFSKEAAKAYGKGDFAAAYEAKKMEYYNFELYNASIAAIEKMQKDNRLYKVIQRSDDKLSKKRELNYINVARAVLKMYDIGPAKKSIEDYLDALKRYDEDAYESFSLLVEPVQMAAKPVGDATYAEYLAMNDLVNSLWDMAGEAKKMTIGGEELQAADVAKELVPEFTKITEDGGARKYTEKETKEEKKKSDVLKEKASYRRFESWTNGITTKGQKETLTKAFNYLFRPVSEADTNLRLKINEANKKLKDIFEKNIDWFQDDKVFVADELKHNFHRDDILMALLHSGNESNLRKLIVGRGWGEIDEHGVLDRSKFDAAMARARQEGYLTKQTYDMAQQVWDLMESFNADTQKAHKKVKGFYFGRIKNTEFTNEFGTYKGGYIPAKLDPSMIKDQKQRQAIEAMMEKSNSYTYPSKSMDSGFAKDRNENYHGPLSLDFHLLGGHIDAVLKFTYMEPARKQMQNLLKNSELVDAINAFDPVALDHIIKPFLDRAKEQKVIIPSGNKSPANKGLQKFASFLRNAATIQIMTGLASSALQQFTGLSVAKTKFLGDQQSHLSNAMRDYLSSPEKAVARAAELSDWFRGDLVNNNFEVTKEVEDIIVNKNGYTKAQDFAKKHSYFMQKATQNIVSTIVWHGAFNQFYERNPAGSQADAVAYADSMVRTTQGTNNPIDVSQGQVVTPFEALFYQFTGYFNMVHNLKQESYERIEREVGFDGAPADPQGVRFRKFMVYFMASALPALIIGQLLRGLRGEPFDKDKDGIGFWDLFNAIGMPLVAAEFAMMPTNPLTRQGLQVAINKFNQVQTDDRISGPGFALFEKGVGAGADIYKFARGDHNRKAMVTDLFTLVGMATSLPIAPLAKPVNYLSDIKQGKAKPTGPIDFTRGFITGSPGKR